MSSCNTIVTRRSIVLLVDCRRDPAVCDLNAHCQRRGAEYFCVCMPGYHGDGYDQCISKFVKILHTNLCKLYACLSGKIRFTCVLTI